MAFISIEDKTGEIEAVVFAAKFERFSGFLFVENPVVVSGTLSVKDDEPPKILLNDCVSLLPNDKFESNKPKTLYLRVPSVSSEETKNALALIGKSGDTEVILYDMQTKKYVKAVGYKANVTDMLVASLSALFGEDSVVVK